MGSSSSICVVYFSVAWNRRLPIPTTVIVRDRNVNPRWPVGFMCAQDSPRNTMASEDQLLKNSAMYGVHS
ncbi:hypothetical protein FBU59_002778 [Linderina macrospora]|uniref:Uncharacterized protein n=1 Tax=Linderina macrospora TaxID=4868 RepID=A0ACC1JA92_9FUNG|nr:hypothetical protein FBU59_002778 [Linderina macrospora]